MDIDELKAELSAATDEALEIADELAIEIGVGHVGNRVLDLARAYQEKRREVRLLRQELKAGVAG